MRRPLLAVMPLVLALGASGTGGSEIEARAKRPSVTPADVVVEWNQLLQSTIPATASLAAPRFYSILHIAMFDAANTVERTHEKYLVQLPHTYGASADLAAAAAAHHVLSVLLPESQSMYDAALATRLERGARDQMSLAVGVAVAQQVLAWREGDGWEAAPPPFVLPPLPGLWQPAPGAAAFTQYPAVKPFALVSGTQFLAPRPPELSSARYAQDFNEVKRLGAQTSAERTSDQTQLVRLFAGVGTRTNLYMLWNNVARDVVEQRGLGLVEAARLYALMNVAIIDGVQTTMSSKYVYGLWRPVTAIRRAGEDMNADTDADPAWTPLLNTPAYPSYAGNQACVASAAARALQIVSGDDAFAVTAVWKTPDGSAVLATRSYSGFRQMAEEQARSRVYGGIHFTFDNEPSLELCPNVTDFIAAHYMMPR